MYREPVVMRRKLELKLMMWTRKKKETSNQKRMKQQEFKKNEERLRNLHGNLTRSNIQIIGCQKGERKSKKLKTYLNK